VLAGGVMDAYRDYITKRRRQELKHDFLVLFWMHVRLAVVIAVIALFVIFVAPHMP